MKVKKTTDIFKDLGFNKKQAVNLQIRSLLMIEIEKFIKEKKMTQSQAADFFSIPQPRISEIIRGKIELFSIDNLINLLIKAGLKIDIHVHHQAA